MRKCPLCEKFYTDYPALSRRDNKTEICPECGEKEALNDYFKSNNSNVIMNYTLENILCKHIIPSRIVKAVVIVFEKDNKPYIWLTTKDCDLLKNFNENKKYSIICNLYNEKFIKDVKILN